MAPLARGAALPDVGTLFPSWLPRRMTVPVAMAISAVIALFCAFWSVNTISLAPPKVQPRHMQIGAAATHVLLDAPTSLVVDQTRNANFDSLVNRATLYGELVDTLPVREIIGRRIGVAPDRIAGTTRLTSEVQREMREPDLERRANQILNSTQPYRLEIQADPGAPVINIYAQAPSAGAAEQLADAAAAGLKEYLKTTALRTGADPGQQVTLEQLGRARGGVINAKTVPEIVALTFLVAFGISLALLLGGASVRRGWIAAGSGETSATVGSDATHQVPRARSPASVFDTRATSARVRRRTARSPRETVRSIVNAGGDWPRTTRVMPWMIAGFLVILWLVPFNVIQLTASLPFDLKLDRIVLPFLFGVWAMSLAAGGPASPRVRLTLIHVAIAGFIGTICLSVVLNAYSLNQALEFETPVKKITLLASFGLFFLIVASSVRRTEVPAFFKYTLGLAILCALGIIWEYRFHYNVFYDLSDKLLPGFFQVGSVDSNERDEIGRLMIRGPAEHPLETVGMLSMAFPIALVGIIHSKERRQRILYGLAACILLAAAISTYRKSALLAPVSVAVTIAYFRRRELLRLAPLGVVSLVVIHALSPGALGSILFQLHPNRLGVSTVSDRTADYDAIRPDVWTHLFFGRGYGSYDHVTYRVLDSEILSRLVDSGILGLLSVVLLLVCIVAAASGLIRSRDPVWSPPALAVAGAAVAFLVLAFLFDVSSFPHTPYILMSLAGLLAVMRAQPVAHPRSAPRHFDGAGRKARPAVPALGHDRRHSELSARR
jgi:hypothetical protein